MRARYTQAMERLYLACVGISGLALVVITLIIPYGVFMRYAMNSAASWPEPLAVLLMVLFSFVGGAAVYRRAAEDRKSTRLNSSHSQISYSVFCLKKKKDRSSHRRDLFFQATI